MIVTRFAPSPTGYLHLGHLYAAGFAFQAAQRRQGRFLLRLEDLDSTRCTPGFAAAILDDLRFAGLQWSESPWSQAAHLENYLRALTALKIAGLVYPCFCTRKTIRQEIEAAPGAPHHGWGTIYPGYCRGLNPEIVAEKSKTMSNFAWRLDAGKAWQRFAPLEWHEEGQGSQEVKPSDLNDIVLAREDGSISYHLAVVVDDALQGVTLVTRGCDLKPVTPVHRLLQAGLGHPPPLWRHHQLIADGSGRRLAKRHDSLSLRYLREAGYSCKALWDLLKTQPRISCDV